MTKKAIGFLAASLCGSSCLWADFTIEQTTQMTGGSMIAMLRGMGGLARMGGRDPLAPIQSTSSISGNRMVTVTGSTSSIVDLDKETITNIDNDKRTYSVITFAQMSEAMDQARAKMKQSKPDAEMNFKVDMKNTGNTKQISGMKASETVLYITLEGTDRKSGQSGAMNVTSDLWLAQGVSGNREMREFHKKMAAKMAGAMGPGGIGALGAMRPEMGKGMAAATGEIAKLDGFPVLTITRMGATPDGSPLPPPTTTDAPPPPPPSSANNRNTASEAAGSAAAGAALGRLGGLAGIGGLGRRKKDAPPAESERGGTTPAADSGVLVETRTEVSSYSSAPVSPAKFEIPSGYQQVDNEMVKRMRK